MLLRRPALFRLDVGSPDHLSPFLGVLGNELPKVGGRRRHWDAAEIGKTGLDLFVGESAVDLLVELLDDFGRRGLRCADAGPPARLVARQELAYSRNVG